MAREASYRRCAHIWIRDTGYPHSTADKLKIHKIQYQKLRKKSHQEVFPRAQLELNHHLTVALDVRKGRIVPESELWRI